MILHKTLKCIFSFIISIIILCLIGACGSADLYDDLGIKEEAIVTIEGGSLNEDGSSNATMDCYGKWVRSAFFIETHGAKSVKIPTNRDQQCFVWQYDADYNVIIMVPRNWTGC